jgi:D-alanyl-D-alanine carboxypeptidase
VTVAGGTQLRSEAAGAFNEMLAAASKAGFSLYANSAYRSYSEQVATFQYWVNTSGLAYAERTSARAGHSEHQLGTTADVGANGKELEAFEGTPEAAWVAANSYKYGFIVSYPDGKESITGYAPEPWHIRYVGKDVAQKVRDSGLTLHEYLLK